MLSGVDGNTTMLYHSGSLCVTSLDGAVLTYSNYKCIIYLHKFTYLCKCGDLIIRVSSVVAPFIGRMEYPRVVRSRDILLPLRFHHGISYGVLFSF